MMRTIQGEPPVEVVWFQVPDDRAAYSGWTVFRSTNWVDDPTNHGLGEQSEGLVCCGKRDVVWYNSKAPAEYFGGNPCGSDAVARRGAIPGVDPTFMTNDRGQAPCCETVFIDCPTPTTGVGTIWDDVPFGHATYTFGGRWIVIAPADHVCEWYCNLDGSPFLIGPSNQEAPPELIEAGNGFQTWRIFVHNAGHPFPSVLTIFWPDP